MCFNLGNRKTIDESVIFLRFWTSKLWSDDLSVPKLRYWSSRAFGSSDCRGRHARLLRHWLLLRWVSISLFNLRLWWHRLRRNPTTTWRYRHRCWLIHVARSNWLSWSRSDWLSLVLYRHRSTLSFVRRFCWYRASWSGWLWWIR